jgi:regulator of sigma E protease
VPLDFILPGLLLLGILVFLHESGHFVVAKLLKVPVYRFSLGFGPALLKFTRGETTYQVSLLPLGGYVSMAEETKGQDGRDELVDRFTEQPWWKRVLIALAGPGANFITGYLALMVTAVVGVALPDYPAVLGPIPAGSHAAQAGLVQGTKFLAVNGVPVTSYQDLLAKAGKVPRQDGLALDVESATGAHSTVRLTSQARGPVFDDLLPPESLPIVGSVGVGSAAYSAGLTAGDRIVSIAGKPVERWQDLTAIVSKSAGVPLDFAVQRDKKLFHVTITPQAPPMKDSWQGGRIGIEAPRARTYVDRSTFKEAFLGAWPLTRLIVYQTFEGLWTVIVHPVKSAASLGGPQMIIQIAGANAKRGLGDFIYILAVISFAIMAFNLLPLPVLDGGHVFLAAVEAVRRRPPAESFTLAYQRVGLVLIGSFLVFVLFNDLTRSLQHRAAVQRNSQAPQGEVRPGL